MTQPRDERPPLHPEEEQFIARLLTEYTPTPLTPARRVEMDTALWTRLRRPRRMILVPALATVAVGMVVAWLTWAGLFTPAPHGGEPLPSVVATPSRVPWEYDLIFPRAFSGANEGDDSTHLPEDYRVIAQVFLDGS